MVELMVGASILIGVGTAGVTLFQERSRNQAYLEHLRRLQVFHTSLSDLLHETGHCNATLGDYVNRAGNQPNTDISRIYKCTTNCSEADTPISSSTGRSEFIVEALANPTNGKQWIDATQTWQVKGITTSTTDGAAPRRICTSGKLNIIIQYELFPNTARSKIVQKQIPIHLKFSAGACGAATLIGCSSEKDANIKSLLQEICQSMNPSGNQHLSTWNTTTQQCTASTNATTDCNPTIRAATGISSTGVASCRSTTQDVDPIPLVDTTTKDCSGGKIPRLGTAADGRMAMQCI